MTRNYYFRQFICDLSIEETAELCFKSVRTVTCWDKGKPIPKECRRLMKLTKNRMIHHSEEWEGFEIRNGMLRTPLGTTVTAREILTGLALLEIQSELEIKTSTFLLKTARQISKSILRKK